MDIPHPGQPVRGSQSGNPIKVGAAYEREFERYLVRMFLEKEPQAVSAFLDSEEAKNLPVENLLLASLSLPPKDSAPRVAQELGFRWRRSRWKIAGPPKARGPGDFRVRLRASV